MMRKPKLSILGIPHHAEDKNLLKVDFRIVRKAKINSKNGPQYAKCFFFSKKMKIKR